MQQVVGVEKHPFDLVYMMTKMGKSHGFDRKKSPFGERGQIVVEGKSSGLHRRNVHSLG
jgi:hypothetical protein